MVGRTPEFLGKKIEAKEMKISCRFVTSIFNLVGTALRCHYTHQIQKHYLVGWPILVIWI
jgi:K+-transporting ATPase A subunit